MFEKLQSKKKNKTTKQRLCFFSKKKGHKKKYRKLIKSFDFKKGLVLDYQYDPYRNCPLILTFTDKQNFVFIPYIEGVRIGDFIQQKKNDFKPGDFGFIEDIPVNQTISYIYDSKNRKFIYSRSAGSFSILISKTRNFSLIKLKSGDFKIISNNCLSFTGTIGSWDLKKKLIIKKAGRNSWLGIRPKVRGVAKNPVDHPHGGGEGRTSGGRPSTSPWGKLTKGVPTVNNARTKFLKNKLIRKYF